MHGSILASFSSLTLDGVNGNFADIESYISSFCMKTNLKNGNAFFVAPPMALQLLTGLEYSCPAGFIYANAVASLEM